MNKSTFLLLVGIGLLVRVITEPRHDPVAHQQMTAESRSKHKPVPAPQPIAETSAAAANTAPYSKDSSQVARKAPVKPTAPTTGVYQRSSGPNSPTIYQHSEGPNSPNIAGDGNQVTINPIPPARKLTDQQRQKLEFLLKSAGSHEIAMRHSQGDSEAQRFQDELETAIVRAGWKLRRPKFLIQEREQYGLWVLVQTDSPPPSGATGLLDALNDPAVGIGAKGMVVSGLEPGSFDLMVGSAEPMPGKR